MEVFNLKVSNFLKKLYVLNIVLGFHDQELTYNTPKNQVIKDLESKF